MLAGAAAWAGEPSKATVESLFASGALRALALQESDDAIEALRRLGLANPQRVKEVVQAIGGVRGV
jgi:hypothetical protein